VTSDEAQKLGFREWTSHYEKEQEADRDKINALADGLSQVNQSVGRLTANVETLIENQRGMFSRINKPPQWGIMISGLMLMALVLGLVTAPMKDDIRHIEDTQLMEIEKQLDVHIFMGGRINELTEQTTENKVNMEWVKMLEGRLDGRLHDAR